MSLGSSEAKIKNSQARFIPLFLRRTFFIFLSYCLDFINSDIPVALEAAWVLAALSQPNHIVPLCSGASFACRLHASSIPLGIPVAFEAAWVLARLAAANHRVHLYSVAWCTFNYFGYTRRL